MSQNSIDHSRPQCFHGAGYKFVKATYKKQQKHNNPLEINEMNIQPNKVAPSWFAPRTLNHAILKNFCLLTAVLVSISAHGSITIPDYPGGGVGIPVASGQTLYANGGEVTVTYQGWQGAAFYEYLFLKYPDNSFGYFFPNHTTPAGQTMSLGSWPAGTEMEFGIYVETTGRYWYSGPGSRNDDGKVHAFMINNYGNPNTTYVGFEDLDGLNRDPYAVDFNYKDEVFTFTGLTAVVPEPSTYLAGLSTLGLLLLGWRKRQ